MPTRFTLPAVLAVVSIGAAAASCSDAVAPPDGAPADTSQSEAALTDSPSADGNADCPCDRTCRYEGSGIRCTRSDGTTCDAPPSCAIA